MLLPKPSTLNPTNPIDPLWIPLKDPLTIFMVLRCFKAFRASGACRSQKVDRALKACWVCRVCYRVYKLYKVYSAEKIGIGCLVPRSSGSSE